MGTPSLIPRSDRRSPRARRKKPGSAKPRDPKAMDPLLTEDQAAEILRVSPRTLQGWRHRGDGPPFVKLGSAVRYRRSDLRSFIVDSIRASTWE